MIIEVHEGMQTAWNAMHVKYCAQPTSQYIGKKRNMLFYVSRHNCNMVNAACLDHLQCLRFMSD
jgi:hypothetical protein